MIVVVFEDDLGVKLDKCLNYVYIIKVHLFMYISVLSRVLYMPSIYKALLLIRKLVKASLPNRVMHANPCLLRLLDENILLLAVVLSHVTIHDKHWVTSSLCYGRYIAGSLALYDKRFDRVNTRSDKKLMRMNKTVHTVTTTDDPIIRKVGSERVLHIAIIFVRAQYF